MSVRGALARGAGGAGLGVRAVLPLPPLLAQDLARCSRETGLCWRLGLAGLTGSQNKRNPGRASENEAQGISKRLICLCVIKKVKWPFMFLCACYSV